MSAQLHVPLLGLDELVAVDLGQLPDVDDVLELLISEARPLSTWFDFAKAYLAQGKEESFRHICNEGAKDEVLKEAERFFQRKHTYEVIQFHCGLAGLNIAKARDEKRRDVKTQLLAQALASLTAAQQLDPEEQLVSLGLGLLHVTKGETNPARLEFVKACSQKNNGQPNVVGYLALAALLYSQQLYKEALTAYRRALLEHPGCPAEVRLGIAACMFKLGDLSGATAAYERVLALDPDCATAHLGLAIIKFNSINLQQGLADGLKLLVRAYELDPGDVGVLVVLAHYCLLRGDYQQAVALARVALESPDADAVRADCTLMLARAHHALGATAEAHKHYLSAGKLDPGAALPHLGMAQMYLAEGSIDFRGQAVNATTELEAALKTSPAFFDALKILGHLVSGNKEKTKSTLTLLQSAVQKAGGDPDLWELLAELSAATGDHPGALKAYRKALDLHRALKKEAAAKLAAQQQSQVSQVMDPAAVYTIPLRLLNNTAVLLYRAGEVEPALRLLAEAKTVGAAGAQALVEEHRYAIDYNMARLQEACGQLRVAQQNYEALLTHNPKYVDCLLRLACIARVRGDTAQVEQLAQKALQQQANNTDALALLSQLYMERRDLPNADIYVKKLLRAVKEAAQRPPEEAKMPAALQEAKHDQYGALAHGNLMLLSTPSDRRKPQDSEKAYNCLYRALELYTSVLQVEPRNAYAANGVGAVLAELGLFDQAQDVFAEVQASVAAAGGFVSIPDLYINLANVALTKHEYTSAVRLYKIALEKLDANKQGQVLLYLARAYYDSDDLKNAKAMLLRAIHIAPVDFQLRFNVALTMQEWAVRTFRKKRPPSDPTKLPEFERAQSELVQALSIFQSLKTRGPKSTKLDPEKLNTHIKFCDGRVTEGELQLKQARVEAAEMAAKRQEQEQMRVIAEQRRLLEETRKRVLQEAEREEQEKLARAALEKAEKLKENWRAVMAVAENAEGGGGDADGGKKRKRKATGGKGKGSKKGARAMAGDDEEPSDDEEEAGTGPSSSEGEEEGGGKKKGKQKEKKEKKRKRIKQGAGEPGATGAPAGTSGGGQEGGGAAPGSHEDLFGSDDEDEEDPAQKALMAKAGLESEDDDDDLFGPDSDGEKEGGTQAAAGGRLRRQQGDGNAEPAAAAGGDELADEDAGNAAQGGGSAVLSEEDGQGAGRRARRPVAVLDSDEEGEQGAAVGGDTQAAGGAGQTQQDEEEEEAPDGFLMGL